MFMINKISKILIASNNKGKLAEISELLNGVGIKAELPDPNISEPCETGKTFEENAILKAKYYGDKSKMISLADDSGLCIDALDGKPGIHSARFAIDEKSGQKDFGLAFEKIKNELASKGINFQTDKINAHFICHLALYNPDTKEIKSLEGRIDGTLTFPPKGENGFGYDPIFIANGMDKTFAEITPMYKDKISHRSKAFEKLILSIK